MSFESDIQRHKANRNRRLRAIFLDATVEVQRSIVEGSELTGSPGQPVQRGTLRGSWVPGFTGHWTWSTTSKLVYAPVIESGPITIRSSVGGQRSVEKTRTGWPRIVDAVTKRHADV